MHPPRMPTENPRCPRTGQQLPAAPRRLEAFGPLDSLHAALRRRYPTVTAAVIRPGALREPGQPDAWLAVAYRDVGPNYIGWDEETLALMWISNPSIPSIADTSAPPPPPIGTPDRIDQAADVVARELRAPGIPPGIEAPVTAMLPVVHGDDGDSGGECPKGGNHSMSWANGAAYCTKCLATF